jgi:hypothetical protein
MKTQRELLIDSYIEKCPESKLANKEPVFIHGKFHEIELYRLPIKLLVFNIANGRFAAELIAEQKRLNRELDPTNDEDINIIQKLLLEQDRGETDALKSDLKKNGQIYPGIITFDGAVINANRRMAILQELYKETEDAGFEFLNVARLPKGVDAKDLWRIEAKLQFGRDFLLEYGQVNELLKIRTGKSSGLTDKQISEALAGRYSEKKVAEKLEILKLMDSYLHSIGKPGEYTHIQEERVGEMFNSLHDNVISPLKKGTQKAEVPKITEIAFAMIGEKKHSHWDIRKLRKVTELPQARHVLYSAYGKDGKLKSGSTVNDAFDTADFIVKMQEEKNRPEKLAEKALSALKEIDSKHPSLQKAEFQRLLTDIKGEVQRLIVLAKKDEKAAH